MLNAIRKGVSWLDAKLNNPLEETVNNLKWLELELEAWLNSKEREDQITADMYYRNIKGSSIRKLITWLVSLLLLIPIIKRMLIC